MKTSRCNICKTEYTRFRPLQACCSPSCAMELVNKARERNAKKSQADERRKTRERLDEMRTKPQLVSLAQSAFNAYIRARDEGKPCISCGGTLSSDLLGGAFDCGHYRSVGSAPHMRFVEDNAHGQCKHCNRYLAGNHVSYRAGLIGRIGIARVEQLEADNTLRKYSKEGLVSLTKYYKTEVKKIKQQTKR